MSEVTRTVARERAKTVRMRIRRHHLVFLPLGAVFRVLRAPLLDELGGMQISAADFARQTRDLERIAGLLVLTEVEDFVYGGVQEPSLGDLRIAVDSALDAGIDVCLVSRSPRVAYPAIPGSSVLDDASVIVLPLLTESECLEGRRGSPLARLPEFGLDSTKDEADLLIECIEELG